MYLKLCLYYIIQGIDNVGIECYRFKMYKYNTRFKYENKEKY